MEIVEIKTPDAVDCCAAYKVGGSIIELTCSGEYAVWPISKKTKEIARVDSFAQALAVALSIVEE